MSETVLAGRSRASTFSSDTGPWSLIRLAAPLVVSRAGLASMTIVDCLMVPHYDARQLALTSLADGTFGRLTDVFTAFLVSALPLVAAASGPHSRDQRQAIFQRSLVAALGLGLVGLVAALFGRSILELTGQDAGLAAGAGAVIRMLGLGLPAGLVAIASAVFLEGARRPNLVALCVLGANVLNLALNWLLIGGHAGLPAMGALGSATGTSLVRVGLAIVLLVAVVALEGPCVFRRAPRNARDTKAQVAFGASMAGTSGGMHALGIWLTVFAGWLGPRSLAAYASGWVLNMPAMLLAVGLGDAVAIRAAADRDLGSGREVNGVLRRDLVAVALILCPFALLLCSAPHAVAALYVQDPYLRELMGGLLPLSGIVLLLDGTSYAVAAALRGRRDVGGPATIQLVCMAATPVLAAAFAFGLHMGVLGMVRAVCLTSALRLALLILRLSSWSRVIVRDYTNREQDA